VRAAIAKALARLGVGLVAVIGGCWALAASGALSGGVSARLGAGLGVGMTLALTLPLVWPARQAHGAFEALLVAPRVAPPEQPGSLREVELAVAAASGARGGYSFYYRLRPLLVEVVRHRLRLGYDIDFDAAPERARALLGDALWDLVDPDLPPPSGRSGLGLPASRLRAALSTLEDL
jgi:hypothetical protein